MGETHDERNSETVLPESSSFRHLGPCRNEDHDPSPRAEVREDREGSTKIKRAPKICIHKRHEALQEKNGEDIEVEYTFH
jgi:hypothetical protein